VLRGAGETQYGEAIVAATDLHAQIDEEVRQFRADSRARAAVEIKESEAALSSLASWSSQAATQPAYRSTQGGDPIPCEGMFAVNLSVPAIELSKTFFSRAPAEAGTLLRKDWESRHELLKHSDCNTLQFPRKKKQALVSERECVCALHKVSV
jgi:hypothetical protein